MDPVCASKPKETWTRLRPNDDLTWVNESGVIKSCLVTVRSSIPRRIIPHKRAQPKSLWYNNKVVYGIIAIILIIGVLLLLP